MSNETPGRDPVPGWGQPRPEPDAEEATAPWPTEAAPPESTWPVEAEPPTAPWPPAAEPAPAAPAPSALPEQPAPAPEQPAPAPGGWGTPPPQTPSWGAPAQQQPPAPAPGGWDTPPQQAPGWGAPAQQQPPGGWGTPPQQAPGWGPTGPGAPGGPPVGWAPAPAKSGGNGCLKACLIVGAIGVVLVIITFIVLGLFAQQFVRDMGINPEDGTLTECPIVSSSDVSSALDQSVNAMPLGGIVDATLGQLLDKRVIPDAEDCWIAPEGEGSTAASDTATGRIARQQGGDASGAYRSARDAAQGGGYFAGDVSGLGDEAFCTGMSEAGSFGVVVRRGDKLVYVSLINPAIGSTGFETNADGVVTSQETCDLAGKVAVKVR